jgi:uncharacterized protein (TIGR01777 family)
MKILITGATGNLGNKVGYELAKAGHQIVVVSRTAKSAHEKLIFPAAVITKNLSTDILTFADFSGVDAVIHLMGETIDGRWTESKKKEILNSRIASSKNLLQNLPDTVKVVISASAQGFYGNCDDQELNESQTKGEGFLADVCDEWERPFRGLKQRCVQLRTGIILDPHSGALKKMIPLFQKNLGAGLGNAKQYMSWISMDDMVQIVLHALTAETLSGPVNCSVPNAVQNSDFTQKLCEALGVLQLPNVPNLVLKIVFGEMSSILTDSCRMVPQKLMDSGFQFSQADLEIYFQKELLDFKNGQSVLEAKQFLPYSQEHVFQFFSEAKNLEVITPEILNFKIENVSTAEIQKGTLIDYKLKIHGVPAKWKTLISDWQPPFQFVDQQLKGPYSVWHHTHEFHPFLNGTLMTDRVKFKLPFGFFRASHGGVFCPV